MSKNSNEFHRDGELLEKLYRKFAWGGARVSGWRQHFKFLSKKVAWIVFLESALALKRTLDIIGSVFGLLIFSPIFAVAALAIKLEDGGPVFFIQDRVGKRGKIFRMYKFRSMIIEADSQKESLQSENEAGDIIFKIRDDPRITRVGKLLRRFSIDEAPQLYNVLLGDMSMVGPRPAIPGEVAKYTFSDRRRLDVIPGITGLWQVKGRSEIDFQGQVSLDIQYIESQSFWGDIVILLKTIPAVLSGRGAY